jgi:hypothetical protein
MCGPKTTYIIYLSSAKTAVSNWVAQVSFVNNYSHN